jgi:hypothetical protein
MLQWKALVCVHEHGWRTAFEKLGDYVLLAKTSFLNVLLLKTDDMQTLLNRGGSAPLSFYQAGLTRC